MKFYNYELERFSDLIFDIKLKGKESRMRTRLLRQIAEYLEKTLQVEKDEILKEYSEKDADGESIFSEDGSQIRIDQARLEEFDREFSTLMNESFSLEENESNKEIILTVGNSLLNCDIEFNGQSANLFDVWCEKFEEAITRYEAKEESQ